VFTSDHGAQEAPEASAVRGEQGVRLVDDSLPTLQEALNGAVRESAQKGPDAFARDLAGRAEAIPWIARAWAQVDLPNAEPSDTFAVLARRSFREDRRTGILGRFGVEMLYAPGVLPFGYARGSTHLTGYLHDRHVPLVFMGAGVEPGRVDDPASSVDVAPTLARIMGIRPPADLDGQALPLR
jgi:arylsulfatase A-like enzyme